MCISKAKGKKFRTLCGEMRNGRRDGGQLGTSLSPRKRPITCYTIPMVSSTLKSMHKEFYGNDDKSPPHQAPG